MTIFALGYAAIEAMSDMPESAMWAMMIGGMVLVSLTIRRRNRSAVVYA